MKKNDLLKLAVASALAVGAQGAFAATAAPAGCVTVMKAFATTGAYTDVRTAINNVITSTAANGHNTTGGISGSGNKNDMWVTLVSNDGEVCAVISSASEAKANGAGTGVGTDSWYLSRVISAQKAFTATGLSTNAVPFSSGMLYDAARDGGSLMGVQFSNPVNTATAYASAKNANIASKSDPMTGKIVGGVNVFGGGVALYNTSGKIGALGVSGDTSCEDHALAYAIRAAASLAPATATDDKLDVTNDMHPTCGVAKATLATKTGFK